MIRYLSRLASYGPATKVTAQGVPPTVPLRGREKSRNVPSPQGWVPTPTHIDGSVWAGDGRPEARSRDFNRRAVSGRFGYLARRIIGGCLVSSLVLASGCTRDWQSQPVSMWNESRYKPLAESKFFPNGSSSQPLVPGTVARGQLRVNDAMYTGRAGGQLVNTFPFTITDKDLARGQERFNIYCSPCHSKAGDGQGMIVKRGFATPPDYHIARLMNAPVGHFYDVITNGYGVMYSYASRVTPEDRWRIAAYIRVLQHTTKPAPWIVNAEGRIQKGATPSPNSIGISNMPGTPHEAGVAPSGGAPNGAAMGANSQPISPAGHPQSGQPGAARSRSTIPAASPVTGGTGASNAATVPARGGAPVKVRP